MSADQIVAGIVFAGILASPWVARYAYRITLRRIERKGRS